MNFLSRWREFLTWISLAFGVIVCFIKEIPPYPYVLAVIMLLMFNITWYSVSLALVTICLSFLWKRSKMPTEISISEDHAISPSKQKKEIAAAADKKKKKEKRKRKTKQMEEDKENSPAYVEKTKVHETLSEYWELKEAVPSMDKKYLHDSLKRYTLTFEEMKKNRFPIEGCVGGETFCKEGVVQRKCSRCAVSIQVSLNGENFNMEQCVYHPERLKSVDNKWVFTCCDKEPGSIGCQTFAHHVFSKPLLHNAKFINVREKKQVRAVQQYSVYALDCEMVYTTFGLEVAKVGLVNDQGLTVYETFVKPDNTIVDYNTQYSGITKNDLQGVTTSLTDVQTYLDQLLNHDTILIGHGLDGDLLTLRLMHSKVIDTAVLFPRENGSKRKLKELAQQFLDKTIQDSPCGHDCIEDARTCMALMLFKVKEDKLKYKLNPVSDSFTPNSQTVQHALKHEVSAFMDNVTYSSGYCRQSQCTVFQTGTIVYNYNIY